MTLDMQKICEICVKLDLRYPARSLIDEAERLEGLLAAKDALNNDLMSNCNQLRDRCWKAEGELARWQKIAIDELARSMYNEAMIGREYDLPNGINGFKEQASKELNLQVIRESEYVERLEIAFVEEITQALELIGADSPQQTAQAALAKIHEE